MTRCTVIVPVRTAADSIQTLAALAGQPFDELLIVGDEDATLTRAATAAAGTTTVGGASPSAARVTTAAPRWIDPPAPGCGFASACNAGAAAAAHPLIAFLQPGITPRSDWLSALLSLFEREPRVVAAGSKLIAPADTIDHAGIAVDGTGTPRRLYAGLPASHSAVNVTRPMQMASGGSLIVRRDQFLAAGGFDETLMAGDAQMDLCLRLNAAAAAPGTTGHHAVYYCHDSVAGCTPLGPDADGSPAAMMQSNQSFRRRWMGKLRPDDVTYYQADGLLEVTYGPTASPATVIVKPPLLGAAGPAEALLAARAHQVHALLVEQRALRARIVMLEISARDGLAASAASPSRAGPAQPSPLPAPAGEGELEPSAELAHLVGGEFRATGEEFLSYFVELGGLRPADHVLDVGCGVGRMAVPLTGYLDDSARYEGFDVMANAIEWCQQHITPRFPSFRFTHAALRNPAYNLAATGDSRRFVFPYANDSFDFVFLTSVFTHLLPDEVRHYLAEIVRVLKSGGRCFSTYFLLNRESEGLIDAGLSPLFPFPHRRDGYRVLDAALPESAVAYDESLIRSWYLQTGLMLAEPIAYGRWCGRLEGLSLQDITVATKAATKA